MPKPSLAQSFFNELTNSSDQIAFLKALVDQNRHEEEWLDFKQAPDVQSDDVQRNWSKSLSGFANTGGGVLIWGIKADKDPITKIDCANAVCLINNPDALKSRLMRLHHQATDPPVLGIKVESYIDPSSNKGFVVCLIPESSFRPHRAEYETNKPYYIRAGDNFVVAPVAMLKAMFYPQSKPYLRVQTSFNDLTYNGQGIRWTFRLTNTGTATASDISFSVKTSADLGAPLPAQDCTLGGHTSELGLTIYCNRPIHPGNFRDILIIDESISRNNNIRFHTTTFGFRMYASDHEPQAAEVAFNDHDFINQESKEATPVEYTANG